jgi:hypothetical protein
MDHGSIVVPGDGFSGSPGSNPAISFPVLGSQLHQPDHGGVRRESR